MKDERIVLSGVIVAGAAVVLRCLWWGAFRLRCSLRLAPLYEEPGKLTGLAMAFAGPPQKG
jgi:hypothetical protein